MKSIIIALATMFLFSTVSIARDQVSIAGSSTVLPFARIIAEEVGKTPSIKTPVVESGGSSVGKKGKQNVVSFLISRLHTTIDQQKLKHTNYKRNSISNGRRIFNRQDNSTRHSA